MESYSYAVQYLSLSCDYKIVLHELNIKDEDHPLLAEMTCDCAMYDKTAESKVVVCPECDTKIQCCSTCTKVLARQVGEGKVKRIV